jgi:hypothetical protein
MRLGGKIHDYIDLIAFEDHRDSRSVANVALLKCITRIALESREVLKIPRVRKLIEINDAIVGMLGKHIPNEVAADEAGGTRGEDGHYRQVTGVRLQWNVDDNPTLKFRPKLFYERSLARLRRYANTSLLTSSRSDSDAGLFMYPRSFERIK